MLYAEYKKIPNKLRKCRLAKRLKPDEVAEILGLKYTSQISQWETGASLPTLVNAFKLAGLYKVFVEDLYFDLMHKTREEVTARAQEVYDRREREGRPISTAGMESVTE
ncbi:MAG: helix-turn-helix transcriptional regulator [Ignavibacteriae bacterium]|nr:helix-turn-helix transcriptional regulator [Ignavibacteria bacterium]MBI3365275.1 helix-turn-helix transcriptional regulator [Ignavibacteriota bacterium]